MLMAGSPRTVGVEGTRQADLVGLLSNGEKVGPRADSQQRKQAEKRRDPDQTGVNRRDADWEVEAEEKTATGSSVGTEPREEGRRRSRQLRWRRPVAAIL